MKYQTDAVTRFTRALFKEGNPKDTAALLTFNWQVQELVSFTRNPSRFETAMKKLRGEAGTSLYDAIFLMRDVEKRLTGGKGASPPEPGGSDEAAVP